MSIKHGKEATQFIPLLYLPKGNLTTYERAALKDLTFDPSLTVREADKGGRLVIINTVDYDASMRSMLATPVFMVPSRPILPKPYHMI